MCMKYINAIITPYASATINNGTILSLNAPLRTVRGIIGNDGKAYIKGFDVVTDLTFLGTANEAHYEVNPVQAGATIDVIIRLTRCAAKIEDRRYIDLDTFSVDLSQVRKDGKMEHACFDYYNHTRITRVADRIQLPDNEDGVPAFGSYVLKVIVHIKGDPAEPTVQSITPLKIMPAVNEPNETVDDTQKG